MNVCFCVCRVEQAGWVMAERSYAQEARLGMGFALGPGCMLTIRHTV